MLSVVPEQFILTHTCHTKDGLRQKRIEFIRDCIFQMCEGTNSDRASEPSGCIGRFRQKIPDSRDRQDRNSPKGVGDRIIGTDGVNSQIGYRIFSGLGFGSGFHNIGGCLIENVQQDSHGISSFRLDIAISNWRKGSPFPV